MGQPKVAAEHPCRAFGAGRMVLSMAVPTKRTGRSRFGLRCVPTGKFPQTDEYWAAWLCRSSSRSGVIRVWYLGMWPVGPHSQIPNPDTSLARTLGEARA